MKLADAIIMIQYTPSWGIWAELPFSPDSEARLGQVRFENGGLLDDMEFFADGVACGDFLALSLKQYLIMQSTAGRILRSAISSPLRS